MTRQLYTINQLADVVGMTPKTIREWCKDNYFESAIKLGKGTRCQWRIPSDDVYLAQILETVGDAGQAIQTAEIAKLVTTVERLESALAECQSETVRLQKDNELMMNDYNELSAELRESDKKIADLQRYKDHYEEQRSQQRKAA